MDRATLIYKAKAKYELDRRRETNPLNYFVPIDEPELQQKEFLECTKKNLNVFGGNRSGKSISGAVKVIRFCLDNPNADCWASTWSDMSVPIQQAEYFRWLPKTKEVKFAKFSEQRGFLHKIIIFANGSKIRFKTYEQGWESFQGAAKDLIHLDEESPEEIVNECKARLIDKNGMLLRTMTPLNGITYTYDEVVINAIKDPEIIYWFFNSEMNPHINKEARDRILGGYAEKEREVRSTGHFLNLTSGQVYYAFDNVLSISDNWNYNPHLPLEISCDFNVDLMYWPIGQCFNGKDFDFDYVELEGQANTDLMCKMIKAKYPEHKEYIFYGDIAGNSRTPSSSKSSWGIIQENFPNAILIYNHIKSIKDRTDSTNGRLKNDKGRHAFISSKLSRLNLDLMRVTWEMLTNKTKAGKLTHASDAYSYKMFAKYPLYGVTKLKGIIER